MTELDKIIRELLKEYTQEELAREIGVSLRSVQNYMTGTRPRREVARKIRELKGIPKGEKPKAIQHPDALGLSICLVQENKVIANSSGKYFMVVVLWGI